MVACIEWLNGFFSFLRLFLMTTSPLISQSLNPAHVTLTRSNNFDCIFNSFYLIISSFISFYSHDDVIGKITLSKEAIRSQAKGTNLDQSGTGWESDRSSEVKLTWSQRSQWLRRHAFFFFFFRPRLWEGLLMYSHTLNLSYSHLSVTVLFNSNSEAVKSEVPTDKFVIWTALLVLVCMNP